MAVFIVVFALLVANAMAAAEARTEDQLIYKCRSGGKISYGQTPCPDGPSVVLKIDPAPALSAADKARLTSQGKAAARLDAERRKQAAKEASQAERDDTRRARAAAATAKKCAALKLRGKWAAEDARAATDKQAAQARLKASRAAEQLALECPV